jgi:Cd2+/Zn2+-exporting ATPase
MIGRYSKLGVYHELFRSRDLYLCAAGGTFALASYLTGTLYGRSPVYPISLALVSVAINGLPIIWNAARGLFGRHINVDELVSLAIVASLLGGEFLAAAVVSFVMTLGGLIEKVTSDSARRAIKSLIRISPETATVLMGEEERVLPVSEVAVGDFILIKPGERVPVDAVIVSGISALDESSMTGEPLPVEKRVGDTILAGTLNLNGVLRARTSKVGRDTTLGKVISLISEAESHRPQATRLIDRYAKWFTPTILVCAGVAWAYSGDISRAVAVLIVGCPCALILAAPTATVAALGRAAKAGVLIKGGRHLEQAASVKAVLFDKTGTLTLGEPKVVQVACAEGVTQDELLSCAASAEYHCTHPLARAILKAAHYANVVVRAADQSLQEIGLGVRAIVSGSTIEVGGVSAYAAVPLLSPNLRECVDRSLARGVTPLVVCRDRQPIGLLAVSDQLRPVAVSTVQDLHDLGIETTAILSGDHEGAARSVADSLGIDFVHANLKPHEKVEVIKSHQAQGLSTMFVGDGINDAPALASAQVGVAMGAAGTDVALETADIALANDDISKLPWLIRLSRRTLTIIKANIAFGLVFNASAVIASGMGWLSPIVAAIAHNAGSILVVMVSASLAIFPEAFRASTTRQVKMG